jgi:hypothetical protein
MISVSFAKNDMGIILTAIGKLKSTVTDGMSALTSESAKELANEIRKNITSQTFGDFGKSHSKKWAAWKKLHSSNADKYWLHTGLLLKQINSRQIGPGRWWVGIDSLRGGKDNPAEYGPIIETERPMFHKTLEIFKPLWNKNAKELIHTMRMCWHK